ncbi:MBL fold metallo-hydrolase [Kitasatospora sp. NPDC059747]|uniref:MBL fold metallo-hydrolase n=1 Tax=Kitasatospora sp. NPDC059747 TaxID=3346930 RepID=UPI003661F278
MIVRMPSHLTVLGTCRAWPEAHRAAGGLLLDHDGHRLALDLALALDLGYGAHPRLAALGAEPDAAVITHEHPDHCADLSALARARHFAPRRGRRLPLDCPPGVLTRVHAMEPTEDLHPLPAAGTLPAGPLRLDTAPLPHHVPHAGVRLTAPGLTLACSGDAGPCPALGQLAAGADPFIAGTTLNGAEADPRVLGLAQAAACATRAAARRLLPTHFRPGADRTRPAAEARAAFPGGEALAAEEGMVPAL